MVDGSNAGGRRRKSRADGERGGGAQRRTLDVKKLGDNGLRSSIGLIGEVSGEIREFEADDERPAKVVVSVETVLETDGEVVQEIRIFHSLVAVDDDDDRGAFEALSGVGKGDVLIVGRRFLESDGVQPGPELRYRRVEEGPWPHEVLVRDGDDVEIAEATSEDDFVTDSVVVGLRAAVDRFHYKEAGEKAAFLGLGMVTVGSHDIGSRTDVVRHNCVAFEAAAETAASAIGDDPQGAIIEIRGATLRRRKQTDDAWGPVIVIDGGCSLERVGSVPTRATVVKPAKEPGTATASRTAERSASGSKARARA
jgi:hypothetical protein